MNNAYVTSNGVWRSECFGLRRRFTKASVLHLHPQPECTRDPRLLPAGLGDARGELVLDLEPDLAERRAEGVQERLRDAHEERRDRGPGRDLRHGDLQEAGSRW